MWIARRAKRHRWTYPPPVETGRPRGLIQNDWASDHRLTKVFREEDEEIDARLGERVMTGPAYRFKCVCCGIGFSLEQLRDAHQADCGKVKPTGESSMSGNGQRPITCRHCSHTSQSLKDHSAHLLDAHREETLARRRELAAQRKAQDSRIDTTATGRSKETPAPRAPAERLAGGPSSREGSGGSVATPPAPVPPANGHEHTCPMCGGPLPNTTAELVAELRRMGLAELQAFEAARTARRVLGAARA